MQTPGEKIAAIILGASEWPKFRGLSGSAAFQRSAESFVQYLKGDEGLHVPQENILSLFDSDLPVTDIDSRIREFLADRVLHNAISDVFVYYSGHGSFTPDQKYIVILRSTLPRNVGLTAYKMQDLSKSLHDVARTTRKWIFLDSCSAAAAFIDFQPQDVAPLNVMAKEAPRIFPRRATALLCASSADEIAKAPRNSDFTMFSGALIEVLRSGAEHLGERISLAEIYELIVDKISDAHSADGVRPEIYTPDQKEGDLARVPFFPNPAKAQDRHSKRIGELERRLDEILTNSKTVAQPLKSLQDDVPRIDERLGMLEQQLDGATNVMSELALSIGELRKASANVTIRASQTATRSNSFNIPDRLWLNVPKERRDNIFRWHNARRNGLFLLNGSIAVLIISIFGAGARGLLAGSAWYSLYMSFAVLPPLCLAVLLLGQALGARISAASTSDDFKGDFDIERWWNSLEVVIRTRTSPFLHVFPIMDATREHFYASVALLVLSSIVSFAPFVPYHASVQ